jgi:hypothetical protein
VSLFVISKSDTYSFKKLRVSSKSHAKKQPKWGQKREFWGQQGQMGTSGGPLVATFFYNKKRKFTKNPATISSSVLAASPAS